MHDSATTAQRIAESRSVERLLRNLTVEKVRLSLRLRMLRGPLANSCSPALQRYKKDYEQLEKIGKGGFASV